MEPIKVEFFIRFDGDAPGLQDHRLSLAAFGEALHHLLVAFRRAADREAKQNESDGEGKRRFGKYGQGIDLHLVKIEDGCARLKFDCVFPATPDLDHVAERTVSRILRSIETEANGGQAISSPSIRKFLEALPAGLHTQEYEGKINGEMVGKKVTLGEMTAIEDRRSAPSRLVNVAGRVISVSFTPERESIRIRTMARESITCLAESHLIEKAVAIRHETVKAQLLMRHDANRLLAIHADTEEIKNLSVDERLEHTISKWDGLLRRLA